MAAVDRGGLPVQRYRKELQEEFPEVDAFVGVDDKETFTRAAWESLGLRQANLMPSPVPFTPRLLTTDPHTAYMRISDGCSHMHFLCNTFVQGKHRSRPMEEIVNEAAALAAGGVRTRDSLAGYRLLRM